MKILLLGPEKEVQKILMEFLITDGNEVKQSKKKIAIPAEAVFDESDGQQRNLDQATRQINLLTEELEELKSRIGEMEEDSKKWRQLAGRDVLTGLPNQTMLFRLVLPKVLGKGGQYRRNLFTD